MTRADLVKQLFRAHRNSDRELFMSAAAEIIDEERRMHHPALAAELARILNNGVTVAFPTLVEAVAPPPRDSERNLPLLEVRHPQRRLEDLVLRDAQQETLQRVILEFRNWDILEANGLRPSNRILFCGPPGCGKTATAEAIATDTALPLLYVRFDSVVSSLLGETASNLRRLFDYAALGNWVVLFDEFDAIGRSRDDSTEHGEIKRVVNSFLQLIDSFQGRSLIIAATNFEQVLDPALWRRFDEIVRFDMPSPAELDAFLRRRLSFCRLAEVDIDWYGKQLIGSSFGDVERVCSDILKTCAIEGRRTIQRSDLDSAILRNDLRWQALLKARPQQQPRVSEE